MLPWVRVEQLPGVGGAYARKLAKLGIFTVEDLLLWPPRKYKDLSLISSVIQSQPGEIVTVQGKMVQLKNVRARNGRWIQKGQLVDRTGEMEVTWFNQLFLVKALKGKEVSLGGKVEMDRGMKAMVSPDYEVKTGEEIIHTGRLVPTYAETRGVSSKWLRAKIKLALSRLGEQEEYLPKNLLKREGLIGFNQALKEMHFPQNEEEAKLSRQRLAFDELLWLHLSSLVRHAEWQKKTPTHPLKIDGEKVFAFLGQLPFDLTGAQKRVTQEILADLGKKVPMNRLLQGDVGSGKTVVAGLAAYVSFLSGFETALMAPTQVLATQHFNTLNELLGPLGVKVGLILSGQKKPKKVDVWVGTHALIHRRADFSKLALVIIDEQHRFGVEQRAHLISKGKAPHVLTMTATPIPRTIALTVYGDLDLSVLDEMPVGRRPVKTWVVPQGKRQAAYEWIKKQVRSEGAQVFVVCPLIEESEAETMQSVRAVTSEYERLKQKVFGKLKLGLLHGRMKVKEKQKVVEEMKKRKIDILVTTPVVEVGVDIGGASIILVEAAERFGLAQLHQLRGRVGRRGQQGYCLLFVEKRGRESWKRLKALEKTNVGSELAELDLKLRGPGEVYGVRQHGFDQLKIASFSQGELIKKTRAVAEELLPKLDKLPTMAEKVKQKIERMEVEPN